MLLTLLPGCRPDAPPTGEDVRLAELLDEVELRARSVMEAGEATELALERAGLPLSASSNGY